MPSAEVKLVAATPLRQESLCVSCPARFSNTNTGTSFNAEDFARVAFSEQAIQAVGDERLALKPQEEDQIAKSMAGLGRVRADAERIGLIARCLIRRVNGGCQ